MFSKLFSIFFLSFSTFLFAQSQTDRTIYLDSSYNRTTSQEYVYAQITRDYYSLKDDYTIEEFYKSGQLKKTGVSRGKDKYNYNGYVVSYYENGTMEEKVFYKDGIPFENYYSWYENGEKKEQGQYVADPFSKNGNRILKINEYWDSDGIQKVVDGNGNYKITNGKSHLSGELKKGFKEGIWTGVNHEPQITYTESYNNGQLISGVSIDKNLVKYNYTEIMKRPMPKKGIEHFYKFVGRKFILPKNHQYGGKIILTFIVDKTGVIDDIKIYRGVNQELNEEAIRVLENYGKWETGKFRGIDVNVKHSLPIVIE